MGATIAGRMTPLPASAGLLTRSGRQNLVAADGSDIPYEDSRSGNVLGWKRGVEWRPRYTGAHAYPGHTSLTDGPLIAPDDWDDKPVDVPEGLHRVVPFLFFGSEGDSRLNQPQAAALKKGADLAAERWTSWHLARHLWTGLAGTAGGLPHQTGNPSLFSQGVDVTPTPGTAIPVEQAVAVLLEAMDGDDWPGDVTFHCARKLLPVGFYHGQFTRDGAQLRVLGSNLLNADPGNPGSAPLAAYGSGSGDGDTTPANATWLYATGAVEWDTEVAIELTELNDLRMVNTAHARVEHAGIVRFHGSKASVDGVGPVAYACLATWRS